MGLADIETDQVRTPGPEPDTASFGMRGTQSVGVKQGKTDARIKLRHKIPMHRLMNILIRSALCHGMEVFVASESATAAAAVAAAGAGGGRDGSGQQGAGALTTEGDSVLLTVC